MTSDMEDSARLTDLSDHHRQHHHHHHRARTHDSGDDECSTDSGCSSGGSSSAGSGLSRRNSGERLCRSGRTPRMLEQRLRGRSTRSQERLDGGRSSERTWSPSEDARSRGGVSPSSYSSSPSEVHSSNDSDFLKRPSSTAETLRRAFQSLKLASSKWESGSKDSKKHVKKSPKRILRSPVSYVYVRGPSGLPTQRVPRNSALQHQLIHPYSCQDLIGLYR